MMKKAAVYLALIAMLHSACALGATIETIVLPDGRTAMVDASGIAQVWSADRRMVVYRRLRPSLGGNERFGQGASLPARDEILDQLRYAPARPYASDEVLVQFRPGVGTLSSRVLLNPEMKASMRRGQAIPSYTNDTQTNRTFAKLGVDRAVRFAPNAYRIHVTASSVTASVAALRQTAAVSYASPNWLVSTMRAPSIAIPKSALNSARVASRTSGFATSSMSAIRHTIPANYAVSASAQSLLNAPGVNAIGAYDEIARAFHQLPGQGEIITNVSLGDLTDASVVSTPPPGRSGVSSNGKGGGGGGGGAIRAEVRSLQTDRQRLSPEVSAISIGPRCP